MAKKSIKAKPGKTAAQTPAKQGDPAENSGSEIAGASASLIVSEILLRSVGRLTRQTLEKAVARRRYDPAKAKAIVENRSILHTVAAYGVTKLATRSIPGALVVGGGLLAKTLFDRGSERRKSRKAAKKPAAAKSEE